ncbi:MAG: ABC-2 family transporter protein [Elusimicrobia bacterium]|nr:ABC-2 family transporter protein [Elusimicrobiota bacterium]
MTASLGKHFRVWRRMAWMSLGQQLSYGVGAAGFLLGKLIRLFFFFAYLVAIFKHTNSLAGYSLTDIAVFFLTFNLVDIVAQIFFRGIYSARRAVEDGDLDYYLIQPCSPLMRMAATMVDFLDIVTVLPVLGLLAATWHRLPAVGVWHAAAYVLLILNGLAIAFSIHVLVAGIAVRTQELENTIWIYRDLMFLGRFPIDIYAAPLRWTLVLLVPIGVMTSFPSQALLGTLSLGWACYAIALAAAALGASLWFWRRSIDQYTSVSS